MKTNENLSNIFGVQPLAEDESSLIEIVPTDVDSDFEFARNNIRDLAEKGKVAVDNILMVAKKKTKSKVNAAGNYTKPGMRAALFKKINKVA